MGILKIVTNIASLPLGIIEDAYDDLFEEGSSNMNLKRRIKNIKRSII